MIVLFEGCDKAGKTTLINHTHDFLSHTGSYPQKEIETPYFVTYKAQIKPTTLDPDAAYYQYKAIVDLTDQNPELLILQDRSYISELVYSGVKRDYDAMDDDRYDEMLSDPDVLLVYAEADKETLKRRFDDDNEDYLTHNDIDEIIDRYEHVIKLCAHDVLRISSLDDEIENVVKVTNKIYEHLRRNR